MTNLVGGRMSDTYGERTTMLGGLLLFCAGAGLCAVTGAFAPFAPG